MCWIKNECRTYFKDSKMARLRLDREIFNLCFLQSCKRNNLIPNFLKIKNRLVLPSPPLNIGLNHIASIYISGRNLLP